MLIYCVHVVEKRDFSEIVRMSSNFSLRESQTHTVCFDHYFTNIVTVVDFEKNDRKYANVRDIEFTVETY